MKKLCLLAVALCAVCVVHAQTEFSVPDLTLQEKYEGTKVLMNRNISSVILDARNRGMTPEEYGKVIGKQWLPVWDNNPEFEQFVGFSIWAWAVLTDEVKILEQSADKVVLLVPSIDKELEEAPLLDTFSIEDMVAYNDGMMQVIAKHLGFNIKLSWGDQGLTVVITR